MEAQARDIPEYLRFLNSRSWERALPEETIFVGAGDSLACAIFAERLTGFLARSIDPYDLLKNPEIAKGKTVYFISVSGKTKTNVEAAIRTRNLSSKNVAITTNPESPLAKEC